MKRILTIIIFFVGISIYSKGEVIFNENNLELDSVIQVNGVNSDLLFSKCRLAISELAGANKSKHNIDYEDRESGVITSKGTLFIGFGKVNPMCGYDVFADCIVTLRCKDNRFKIIIKVPSLTFDWTCDDSTIETVPINVCFPHYNKKIYKSKYHYISNASDKCVDNLIPTLNEFMQELITIATNNSDDDF